MAARKCNKCGHNYVRKYCDYCRRAERWSKSKYSKHFTPRLQLDFEIDVKLHHTEVNHVRSGGGLYLTGTVGCGKSLYAANVMIESMRQTFITQVGPREHQMITVPNLLDAIRQSFKDTEPAELDLVTYFGDIDFLILDDLGVEKQTDWVLEKLYQIINYRYENLKPTIFTSNLSLQELAERLGDRIPSRIKQMSKIKRMKAIDYRII